MITVVLHIYIIILKVLGYNFCVIICVIEIIVVNLFISTDGIIKKEIIVVNLFISTDGIIKKEIIVVNLFISTDGMT